MEMICSVESGSDQRSVWARWGFEQESVVTYMFTGGFWLSGAFATAAGSGAFPLAA